MRQEIYLLTACPTACQKTPSGLFSGVKLLKFPVLPTESNVKEKSPNLKNKFL